MVLFKILKNFLFTIKIFLFISLLFYPCLSFAEEPKTDPKSGNEGMVYIEGGFFIMGDEDTTATVVLLSPYWID